MSTFWAQVGAPAAWNMSPMRYSAVAVVPYTSQMCTPMDANLDSAYESKSMRRASVLKIAAGTYELTSMGASTHASVVRLNERTAFSLSCVCACVCVCMCVCGGSWRDGWMDGWGCGRGIERCRWRGAPRSP
eukprot:353130-Chlamydomonas_euryale.AAC.2